jgi:tRNA (cytidine/uridine-2'-O-)-methyltransferase
MISVALYEPEIPPNTGNIARLCAAMCIPLHIVGYPAFSLSDKAAKRAGLDYWPFVELHRHATLADLQHFVGTARLLYLSTKVDQPYHMFEFLPNDCLVFGPETRGLPEPLLRDNPDSCLTIPMPSPNVRSLNLATAAAMVVGEALRQVDGFKFKA